MNRIIFLSFLWGLFCIQAISQESSTNAEIRLMPELSGMDDFIFYPLASPDHIKIEDFLLLLRAFEVADIRFSDLNLDGKVDHEDVEILKSLIHMRKERY